MRGHLCWNYWQQGGPPQGCLKESDSESSLMLQTWWGLISSWRLPGWLNKPQSIDHWAHHPLPSLVLFRGPHLGDISIVNPEIVTPPSRPCSVVLLPQRSSGPLQGCHSDRHNHLLASSLPPSSTPSTLFATIIFQEVNSEGCFPTQKSSEVPRSHSGQAGDSSLESQIFVCNTRESLHSHPLFLRHRSSQPLLFPCF